MDTSKGKVKENEEKLREYACIGDQLGVENMVLTKMVNVNSTNVMNNWTALHWAAKRGHIGITEFLLKNGANKYMKTNKGKSAHNLATNPKIKDMLKGDADDSGLTESDKEDQLPIVPHYLTHPRFPYSSSSSQEASVEDAPKPCRGQSVVLNHPITRPPTSAASDNNELVLKVRVANDQEKDFIEIELDRMKLTFELLVSTMCRELQVNASIVYKVRKLPDTILRKDKDVWRLTALQELELVLANPADLTASSTTSTVTESSSSSTSCLA